MASDAVFQVFSIHNEYNVREYRKRRLHSKTHTGCGACRSKRVKCDESKPVCTRCMRNNRACHYGTIHNEEVSESFPTTGKTIATTVHADGSYEPGVSEKDLMQYCTSHWSSIFDIAAKDDTLAMAEQYDVLRRSLLAMGASHLRRGFPTTQHRIAEHYYQSLTLEECQQHICFRLHDLDQHGIEALALSALLLNMVAFALPEDEKQDADLTKTWVFSHDVNRLDWLTLQEGLRHLFMSTGICLPTLMSFMTRIFLGHGEVPRVWITDDFAEVPEHWRVFFDLDNPELATLSGCNTGLSRGSIFRPAINVLMKTSRPISQAKVYHFFPFLTKVNTDLRALILVRDGHALWLLAYWYALMLHCEDLWWFHGRVRRDYKAIRLCLERSDQARNVHVPWQLMFDELDQIAEHG